jgi:two-component system, chemotaxis family, sensor kinase CheA
VSFAGFDPEILQDFLTESGELLDALEGDLVVLETTPQDPELLNRVFRALHTIKGSASFLALTNLVRLAHAAESALNAARGGQVVVNRPMMDLLLQAVDILKKQMGQLRAGEDLIAAPDALVAQLARIGEGVQPGAASEPAAPAAAAPSPAAQPTPAPSDEPGVELKLQPGKADLLDFFAADLEETVGKLSQNIDALRVAATRRDAGPPLAELCEAIARSADFFEVSQMQQLILALSRIAKASGEINDADAVQIVPRALAITTLLTEQTAGIRNRRVLTFPIDTLVSRIDALLGGTELQPREALPVDADAAAALVIDLVRGNENAAAISPNSPPPEHAGASPAAQPASESADAKSSAPGKADDESGGKKAAATVEQTIRVDVTRLESLMNLVGELVLQKNRMAALVRGIDAAANPALREQMGMASEGLERITADIQVAVMRTRMQPLDKLFGKYPRLIRDLARKTGKNIELAIVGGETEVDKSVIEELGDPLIHLMRNSADHGLESPEERRAAGKSETGIIKLIATHEGSHVRLQVADNGRGLNRDRIAKKAIERGLVKADNVASMSDRDVFQFIFLPGFSTADQVSDLSGRGVGMDVVRTNIEKIKGTIDLASLPGQGTTITIIIPLTVAIMPAMMVEVAKEIYAIPLNSILEIVKPSPEAMMKIGEHPVLRLRNEVLPLMRAHDLFESPPEENPSSPFTVVMSMSEKRVGLMVSRLIGQQEIVIKPLDGVGLSPGRTPRAVSGATVRDDGGVSLIVDVAELLRMAETRATRAA